jgi:hypothetical protein
MSNIEISPSKVFATRGNQPIECG